MLLPLFFVAYFGNLIILSKIKITESWHCSDYSKENNNKNKSLQNDQEWLEEAVTIIWVTTAPRWLSDDNLTLATDNLLLGGATGKCRLGTAAMN